MAASLDSNRRVTGAAMLALGTVLAVGLFLGHALAVHYVVDDAYISFQYARNLAQGNGLVYNVGQRVEGYTNFLWVLILAGIQCISPASDMLRAARVLGLTLGAATIVMLAVFSARRNPAGGALNLVAALFLACNSSFAAWSTGGLESTLFAFLLLLTVLLCDRELRDGDARSAWPASIAAALLVLTRADGFVAFGLLTLWRLFETRRAGRPMLSRANAVWLGAFVAVFAPHVAWRLWYYGYPMPNTSYAKVGVTLDQLVRGFKYVSHYFGSYGGVALPALILLGWTRGRAPPPGPPLPRGGEGGFQQRATVPRQHPALRGAIWFVVAWMAYVFFVGGDGLAFYRFMGYIAPLIALAAQEGVRAAGKALAAATPRIDPLRARLVGAALVLAVAALCATEGYEVVQHPDETILPYHHYDNYFVDRCAAAGRWLAANTPRNAVVASTPAGAVAFYSQRHVIDMLGLTDAHIARAPVPRMGKGRAGHEKGDGRYVLERKPDFILLGNVAVYDRPYEEADIERTLCQRSEHELWKIPAFHEHYRRESVRIAERGLFQYFTFYRRIP